MRPLTRSCVCLEFPFRGAGVTPFSIQSTALESLQKMQQIIAVSIACNRIQRKLHKQRELEDTDRAQAIALSPSTQKRNMQPIILLLNWERITARTETSRKCLQSVHLWRMTWCQPQKIIKPESNTSQRISYATCI